MRFSLSSPREKTLLVLCAAATLALSSCRLYKLQRQLDGEDALFLSQVRYIITKEERKIYLEMPKSERESFKEDFWKKRDPDPFTETNEFKTEYFDRMEKANRLFTVGKPGWLTDRGKTLILLGPPLHKSLYPMGSATEGLFLPTEVWYYPDFPVLFIDSQGTGDYQHHFLSLGHQAEVLKAMLAAMQSLPEAENALFDYDLDLKRREDR